MTLKNLTIVFALGGALIGTLAVALLPASQIILGLCGVALLGAVLFFWNSLRTLGGDTDVPGAAPRTVPNGPLEALIARKKMLLLSLKDLENERKLGKILQEDFDDVSSLYREEVKSLMRKIDAAAEPFRDRAEELARAHLRARSRGEARDGERAPSDAAESREAKHGANAKAAKAAKRKSPTSDVDRDEPASALVDSAAKTRRPGSDDDDDRDDPAETVTEPSSSEADKPTRRSDVPARRAEERESKSVPTRVACPACNASNEPDAKFCKECAANLRAAPKSTPIASSIPKKSHEEPSKPSASDGLDGVDGSGSPSGSVAAEEKSEAEGA